MTLRQFTLKVGYRRPLGAELYAQVDSCTAADEPTITLNTLQGGQGFEDTY